ncbi:MAG: DEAD/DEAH box helicase family protein [Acidobacteriota bacterium]|nr:DEAD/DEAH box helicase family protein [Acidobacteriota bacterium]
MAPRFDSEKLTLDLAVADLLEGAQLRSLGFGNRGGYERLWLGQAIHSRYQEERLALDPTYRREVFVSHRFTHRGWQVTVQGRIDGLRREPDGTLVVEEIKSVRRGGALQPPIREMYQRQALLYAWMLGKSEERPVGAELVLIAIGSDETEREPLSVHLEGLEASVRRRVNGLLRAWEADRQRAHERRQAAQRLAFPYAELRPGQELILAAVETAVGNREHLLLQATTGIGKTVAALFPALRYCLAHDKRLFVLTAKTLQQEMATSVLGLLNQDAAFRSLRLRAKAKMCANDQVICHEEYCRFAKDYYLKRETSGVLGELYGRFTAIEPDDVFRAAQAAQVCPFEISLELSSLVDVTVCDYNYAFDPYVSLPGFGADQDLSDTVLVIDEVHNLVERGRGYYSPELSAAAARRAALSAGHGGQPLDYRLAGLCTKLAALLEDTVALALEEGPPGDRAVEVPLPEERFWQLRPELDAAFIDYLEHQRESRTFRPDDPFVGLYFDFLRFLNGLAASDAAFSHMAELRQGDCRVKILCKDPSRFLGAVLERTHATIGLSATLSPPEFYTGLLGFEPGRTAFVEIPNPFPAGNRRVVIDATVATTWRERPANYDRIALRLAEFADAVPGNCLALFPSYGFLAEVAGRMRLDSKRLLIQRQADSDRERELILATLRGAVLGDVLLLAVAGGAFAEGVDYPGDVLKAVAVVGPCLPALTLEQQVLKEYYQDRFERGFEYAFVVPGMTRVVQAAGRLIRSPHDTGVIALFDQRFLHSPYRDHLPADWLPEAGAGALAGNPAETAQEFFRLPARRR